MKEQVIEFIACECGLSQERVTLSSDLSKDLGITGDDAFELMNKYAQAFNVDLTDFPHPYEVFGSEAFNPFVFLPRWWKNRKHRIALTVGDLVELAQCHSWRVFAKK